MNYISTRSTGLSKCCSFLDVLLGGLAKDGGLYMPAQYPRVSDTELSHWRTLSYADLAFEVIRKFCDDIPTNDLLELTRRTYRADVYSNIRDASRAQHITPFKTLGIEGGAPLSLLELSNGPTLAFKDIAMQLLGNLFEYALAACHHQQLNILGATSGDTGSAAEYAMRGKRGIRVFMLSPYRKMSAFQTAQMFCLQDPNIFNIAVEGVFDDCQDIIKAVSNDHEFREQYKIGTVNSINWARINAQVVYYFRGYFDATCRNDQRVSFTVPSGNFGNVCAGHIARMMGLPIEKLVVATNENNVLDEFFRTGRYRARSATEIYHTSSPSMDISKASNFERFIFDLIGRDPIRISQLFCDVETNGGFDLAMSGDFTRVREFGFVSSHSTHADRIETIRDIHRRYKIIIDTHTADGVKAAREYLEPGVPMIVLETAQAIKFSDAIREALDLDPLYSKDFGKLEALPQRFTLLPADAKHIKNFIRMQIER
ncbi:threonine synthase [Candidatus Vallotiella sp. (ex Adelges kitamiensis)]|uniref:threonine synthase n=1 Tax=Candidatus Vallotiella sp. (ex Adelges kitamiensis) TaxID=2864217 RepID=UPI001CE291B2|nr:threonine synthase [Candidatus Vallotia sp. (ex Adelges kitamiensis)]